MAEDKEIRFSNHAVDQMNDRGTSKEEVRTAIRDGKKFQQKGVEKPIARIFPLNLIGKEDIIQLSR